MGEDSARGLALSMVEGYDAETLGILRRYVSPVIQRAISARTLDAVSCFTDISVMFVGISDVRDPPTPPNSFFSLPVTSLPTFLSRIPLICFLPPQFYFPYSNPPQQQQMFPQGDG